MSNLYNSLMNGNVPIRILRFVSLSKVSLPYSGTLISLPWLSDRRDVPMFIKSLSDGRDVPMFIKDFQDIIYKLAAQKKNATSLRPQCCKITMGLKCLQSYAEICNRASGWTLISIWQAIYTNLAMNVVDFLFSKSNKT